VLQMATLNTAEYFGVSRNLGLIASGRYAEILLVKDLNDFRVDTVISHGQVVAQNGKLLIELPPVDYPEWVLHSVHVPRKLIPSDFRLKLPEGVNADHASAHVIGVIADQAPTTHLHAQVKAINGEIRADTSRDLAKIALIERHHSTGRIQIGLVQGFGFTGKCAVASTVAHDCHHMLVVGTEEAQMEIAANALVECGGGQVVVKNGEIIGKVELPIAGLMSNQAAVKVAKEAATVLEGFRKCGCNLDSPNMQLSLLALAVIPELRISDLGLVDAKSFNLIPVIE